MEHIFSQRIWTISQWSSWQNKRNQHYNIHPKTRRAKRMHERCHVKTICFQHTHRESQATPNVIHSRRRQNQLPRRSSSTDGGHASCKKSISTHGAKFMTIDTSNFYLMTPLTRPEYMICMKLINISEEIVVEYRLMDLVTLMATCTSKQTNECVVYHRKDCWWTNF